MAKKPTPAPPKLVAQPILALSLLLPAGYAPAALTVAVAPMTSYQPLLTAFPAATFDAATRTVTIPAAGSGYPAKITVRIAAGPGNLTGQALVINAPFGAAPVVVVPAPGTYATKLTPGQSAGSVTYTSPVSATAFLFTSPLSTSTQPDPATMLVYAPGGAPQLGQVNYNGADTGRACGYLFGGKTYDIHFTRGALTLS